MVVLVTVNEDNFAVGKSLSIFQRDSAISQAKKKKRKKILFLKIL